MDEKKEPLDLISLGILNIIQGMLLLVGEEHVARLEPILEDVEKYINEEKTYDWRRLLNELCSIAREVA